jgi:hypothetical protein
MKGRGDLQGDGDLQGGFEATLKETGEQETSKITEKTTLKTAQNQNRTSINEARRRDIINILPNSQQGHEKASKDEGWITVIRSIGTI